MSHDWNFFITFDEILKVITPFFRKTEEFILEPKSWGQELIPAFLQDSKDVYESAFRKYHKNISKRNARLIGFFQKP